MGFFRPASESDPPMLDDARLDAAAGDELDLADGGEQDGAPGGDDAA